MITDDMFLVAARCLAQQGTKADLQQGSIYPPMKNIRDVSLKIAIEVANYAFEHGLARAQRPDDVEQAITNYIYEPKY